MSTPAIDNEADILSRVVSPDTPSLPRPVADLILAFDFPRADRSRMDILSAKAREGTLSRDEQNELDAFERVGHFLSLLQSKARSSLSKTTSNSES